MERSVTLKDSQREVLRYNFVCLGLFFCEDIKVPSLKILFVYYFYVLKTQRYSPVFISFITDLSLTLPSPWETFTVDNDVHVLKTLFFS